MSHEAMIELFKPHMLAQMYANDNRNGCDGQYVPAKNVNTVDAAALEAKIDELVGNVYALKSSVYGGMPSEFECTRDQVLATIERAANVANMAMLVAFEAGALKAGV